MVPVCLPRLFHTRTSAENYAGSQQFRVLLNCCHTRAYLRPGTLPDTDNSVLVGVEDLPNFAHGLWVCGGGGEVPIEVQPAKQTSPAVVALSSVG